MALPVFSVAAEVMEGVWFAKPEARAVCAGQLVTISWIRGRHLQMERRGLWTWTYGSPRARHAVTGRAETPEMRGVPREQVASGDAEGGRGETRNNRPAVIRRCPSERGSSFRVSICEESPFRGGQLT